MLSNFNNIRNRGLVERATCNKNHTLLIFPYLLNSSNDVSRVTIERAKECWWQERPSVLGYNASNIITKSWRLLVLMFDWSTCTFIIVSFHYVNQPWIWSLVILLCVLAMHFMLVNHLKNHSITYTKIMIKELINLLLYGWHKFTYR